MQGTNINRIELTRRSSKRARKFVVLLGVLFTALAPEVQAQLGPFDRDSARTMLDAVRDDLKKNYYDSSLRGLNDQRFSDAEARIRAAKTRDELILTIAQVLIELDDSHTFFLPPFRAARVRYGWAMQIFGADCYVTEVNPKSDAAAKGLKAGDLILEVDGYRPTRDILWKMYYRYYALMPARSVRLKVQTPGDAQAREIEVLSKIEKTAERAFYFTNIWRYNSETRLEDDKFYEQGNAIVWRMPSFEIDQQHVDLAMKRASKFKHLILDLRGNGGGYQSTLEHLVGYFFDHDVKVADLKGRKEMKPIQAKSHREHVFKGSLVVLVDAESGSAAELFARIIQLEKRGVVIGDRTAGAVMVSKSFDHETGVGGTLYFGASITIANVTMPDGGTLEKTGVVPDEVVLPTPSDIAQSRDPLLSKAFALVGEQLAPDKAGSLFPVEWLK
jgi:carboxyl-terminal processing protease